MNNNKIDLIAFFPSTGLDKKNHSIGMPLSLLHATSLANEAGFKIKLIDQRVDKNWKNTLRSVIHENPDSILLLSTMTGAQIKYGLEVIRFVKSLGKNVKIMLGGMHPTLFPKQTLKHKLIDFVVMGDGEETLLEFLQEKDHNLGKIKGLGYKKNGIVIINAQRQPFDLGKTPKIPYNLINVQNYYENFFQTKNELPVMAGRGCPYSCTFCYENALPVKSYRNLPLDKLILNIKEVLEFKPGGINLINDLFFYDEKSANIVADRIIFEGIKTKFMVNTRVDFIYKSSTDTLKKIKDAGFHEMFIGVESGSQRVLDMIKKGITIEQIIEANKKLREAEIKPIYSFMTGFPSETFGDTKKTISLMLKLLKDNPNASLTSLKIFTPYPKTPMFEECKKYGFQVPNELEDWAEFDFNTAKNTWLSKRERQRLEKISYMTYFLDSRTIQSYFSSKLFKMLIQMYGNIVLFRCRHHFYALIPEIKLFKIIHKKFY